MRASANPASTLADIRAIMQRSSRFISLSGLSGIAIGLVALAGAGIFWWKLNSDYGTTSIVTAFELAMAEGRSADLFRFLLVLCAAMIVAGLGLGVYFTSRRARQQGQKVWDHTAKRLLINLAIPLMAGGLFCLLLFMHGVVGLVMPAMLLFYGLTMLHVSKFSFDELRNMGLSEVALGLVAGIWIEYALLFWAIGFGLFPILYGINMYRKYERNAQTPAA